jgi:hypothetical protein
MNSDEIKNVQKLIMNYKKQIQSLLDTKATIHIDSEDYSLLEKKQTQLLEDLQKILYDFNKSTSATNEDNNIELPLNANSIEEEYYKYDCAELPGYIFFHDSIIKSYGLCPFINIPENGLSDNLEDSLVKLKENRISWLQSQNDKGKIYYDMYDTLVNNKDVTDYINQKEALQNEIEHIINITFDVNQKQMYNDALLLLQEYNLSKVKSKTLKEKYKKIVYYFSKLFNETHIHIHEYISLKFDTQIVINYLDGTINIYNDYLTKNFKEYLDKYTIIKTNLTNSLKYVKNTKKHLHQSLVSFLKTKEPDIYIQEGKYYKKWSLLSVDEQCERLDSFVKFYISKRKMFQEKKEDYITKLASYLKDSLKNKILKYNLMKWNIKTGMIDSVLFEYNEENDEFKLKIKTVATIKKPVQTVTLFTKENEQYINESILNFLIKNKKENGVLDNEYQDICFDKIKTNLELKKISKNDKVILKQKYNSIYDIIIKN